MNNLAQTIISGNTSLGIELGSTRIKAVLIADDLSVISSASSVWSSSMINGYWSYTLEQVWDGLREAWANLCANVKQEYGVELATVGNIGISAMMHGYLAFDENDELLTPFRTWQNTSTGEAAKELSELFDFNIPLRWSIAHLYQAILNKEEHVPKIEHINTLAGYVHYKLTGNKVLGIGDASGMFPIDSEINDYDKKMLHAFNGISKPGFSKPVESVLPRVLKAGQNAGVLTLEGAKLLDPSGKLQPGIPMCPPEGDAGTGMVATNAVAPGTGNVSAGTSIFSMIVMQHALSRRYEQLDMVTTPAGKPVAMVHCINCTSDLNEWAAVLEQYETLMGHEAVDRGDAFTKLYKAALKADEGCGGITVCPYKAGEHITGFDEGRPLLVRGKNSRFTIANLMRAHIYSSFSALAIGMELLEKENVELNSITGHGGLFKTEGVAQVFMAAALKCPVNVMSTASEGGAWGIALLAAYMKEDSMSLEDFLSEKAFGSQEVITEEPTEENTKDFNIYLERYKKIMAVEAAAIEVL